jgi:hypothetical protein
MFKAVKTLKSYAENTCSLLPKFVPYDEKQTSRNSWYTGGLPTISWAAEESGFDIREGKEISIFSTSCNPVWGSSTLLSNEYRRSFAGGIGNALAA